MSLFESLFRSNVPASRGVAGTGAAAKLTGWYAIWIMYYNAVPHGEVINKNKKSV